jgi:hypothetical protein
VFRVQKSFLLYKQYVKQITDAITFKKGDGIMKFLRGIFICAALLGLLFVPGCGDNDGKNTVKTSGFLPLDQGNSWTFQASDITPVAASVGAAQENTRSLTVSGTETVNGVEAIKLDEGDGNYSLWTQDETDGLMLHKVFFTPGASESADIVFDPPITILPAEAEIGSEASAESTATITTSGGVTVTASGTGDNRRISETDTLQIVIETRFLTLMEMPLPFRSEWKLGMDAGWLEKRHWFAMNGGEGFETATAIMILTGDLELPKPPDTPVDEEPIDEEPQEEIKQISSFIDLNWNFFQSKCINLDVDLDDSITGEFEYSGDLKVQRGDLDTFITPEFQRLSSIRWLLTLKVNCNTVFTSTDEGTFTVTGEEPVTKKPAPNSPLSVPYRIMFF